MNKTVNQGADSGWRELLHDAGLVGGRDNDALLGCHQQVATGLAILAFSKLVQKTRLVQPNDPEQGTNNLALCIAQGHAHANNRGFQLGADDGLANRGFAVFENGCHIVNVDVVGADATVGAGDLGNRRAIKSADDDAAVEQGMKDRAFFQQALRRRRIAHGGR